MALAPVASQVPSGFPPGLLHLLQLRGFGLSLLYRNAVDVWRDPNSNVALVVSAFNERGHLSQRVGVNGEPRGAIALRILLRDLPKWVTVQIIE